MSKALVALFLMLATVTQAQDPAKWDLLSTFNGHTYYISKATFRGTQIKAEIALPSTGSGYVAAIATAAENASVAEMIRAYNASKYMGNGKSGGGDWRNIQNPWIGFTDAAEYGTTENNFIWSNGQPDCNNFLNWNIREPNNFSGTTSNGEDYAQILIMEPYIYYNPLDPNDPLEGTVNDPYGKWNDWFNEYIAGDPAQGETELPIVLEVGPRECPLNFTLAGKTEVSCDGQNNGTATFTINSGLPPFTYVLDGGEESPEFNTYTFAIQNLTAGTHTVVVTDALDNSQSVDFTIEQDADGGSFNVPTETFSNKFNSWFIRSLNNATFVGSSGTWTVSSDDRATMVVTTPYYSPSTSYALKVVNFKTQGCGSGWTKATSPKLNLTGPCCPSEVKLNFTLWTYHVVNGDTKAKLEIDFSADNGVTWTEVWSRSSNQLYDSYGDNGKVMINIPVPTSYQTANFRYRIRGEMDADDCNNFYVFIDDINVTSPAVCTPLGSIGNFVWNDMNGNGKQDGGELGLANVSVKLTRPDATTTTTTTNASGNYSFTGLAAGNYTVSFTTPSGFVPTLANQGADDAIDSDPVGGNVAVSLAAGQNNNTIDAGFKVPVCTNTTNHTETFPNKFNTNFYTSLYNKTFVGSSGTWTVNSDDRATMVVTTPYYSPSTSYALKVVQYNTNNCGSSWSKAVSPKVDLSNPCCPSELKMNFTLWTYKVVNGDTKAKLEIDFSNNNGSTWTEVWSRTSNELYDSHGANGKTTITIAVPVSYQNSNFRYRIRGEMASGDYNNFYVFIDDIKIGSPATCNISRSANARTMGSETTDMENGRGKPILEAVEEVKGDLTVSVFPNPTNAEFEMRLSSKETTPVSIKVVDMLGRIVKYMRTSSNQSVRFGSEFRSGSYIVEVTQGERTEVVKLIKF